MNLPAGLEVLQIGPAWRELDSSSLGKLALPPKLRVLRLPNLAQLDFDGVVLPPTFERLTFDISEQQPSTTTGVRSLMSLVVPPSMLEVTLPDPGHSLLRYEDDAERAVYSAWIGAIEARPSIRVRRLVSSRSAAAPQMLTE